MIASGALAAQHPAGGLAALENGLVAALFALTVALPVAEILMRAFLALVRKQLVESRWFLGLAAAALFGLSWLNVLGAARYETQRDQPTTDSLAAMRRAAYPRIARGIGGPAVREVKLGSAASPLYRYDGLRLLEVSGGRFFFLHDGWTVRNGVVVVLPDDNSVRIEFGR